MHWNIVLAALFAGSQIAATAVAHPRNRGVWNTPDDSRRPQDNYPQGYIGKQKGHSGPQSSRDDAPSQEDSGPKPSGHAPTSKPDHSNGPSGYGPSGNSYQAQVLKYHNIHRANHSAPALKWSEDLAQIAETIAGSCVFKHNLSPGGGGYGQNIAAGTPPGEVNKIISDEFYNGEEPDFDGLYGLADPPMSSFEQWGHFTQLVWKSTKEVGCATVHCPRGVRKAGQHVPPYFTVCNYKGPGNVAGGYAKNVGRPLGHAKVGA